MQTFIEKQNLQKRINFYFKSSLLIALRLTKNIFSPVSKFKIAGSLMSSAVISWSQSELWNDDDNEQNWILTAGKIENLRIAARRLNGIEVPANEIFSFWKHIGNPHINKGYVTGREIREGCILPTIAGGLCQLSNALYDTALKADFEIIERHRHSKIIKHSLAEQDRDATIKWNYIDLRFRFSKPFRIEVELLSDKLIVKLKSDFKVRLQNLDEVKFLSAPSKLNDCYSCGNLNCIENPGKSPVEKKVAITTFILDERWNEYNEYVKSIATEKDFFIIPLSKNKFFKSQRYNWEIRNKKNIRTTTFRAIQRALLLRLYSGSGKNIFSLMISFDKKIAKAASRLIPIESKHIVASQNLLPFLLSHGALGGRTFDVLMTRLPMEKLHERLDEAYSKYPQSKTLNDFRAKQNLIDIENYVLTRAQYIITPHKEIADIFNNKSIRLNWYVPKPFDKTIQLRNKILFPASALARKGAYEVKRLAKELNLNIVVIGKKTGEENFWEDVPIEIAGKNPFDNIALVIYPAYIEHQPRLILKAISAGLPVITTTACGLVPAENLKIIDIGDFENLKISVQQFIDNRFHVLFTNQ